MTPTAEHADIVLPKTRTLEEEEVSFMPSGPTVLFTHAVVPPQGLRVEKPEGERLHRRGLTEPSRRLLLPCRVEYKSQIPTFCRLFQMERPAVPHNRSE
jgi:anaerobic selenocysteine-containing dehydrogenase